MTYSVQKHSLNTTTLCNDENFRAAIICYRKFWEKCFQTKNSLQSPRKSSIDAPADGDKLAPLHRRRLLQSVPTIRRNCQSAAL